MMALYRALAEHEVPVLLSMIPESSESYMYHVPNINLTEYSADAIGIPLVMKETSGVPPQENLDLKVALKEVKDEFDIDGITTGAVRSNYQFEIISGVCRELNLEVFAPYWQKSHASLIRDAINAGFEILIVGVAAHGMDESWLGRRLNIEALGEIIKLSDKFGIDTGGEGGEYETLVVDGPIFRKRIEILKSSKKWDGVRGELIIGKVELVEKNSE